MFLGVGAIVALALQRTGGATDQDALEGSGRDNTAVVGTPEVLPFVTTELTEQERKLAESLAFEIQEVAESLRGDRYRVVGAEIAREKYTDCDDPVARDCAQLDIFSYTDGRCVVALVNLAAREPVDVYHAGGCSVGAEEVEEARRIAERDERVQEIVRAHEGQHMGGHQIVPRDGIAGHRYVSAEYTLDGGAHAAEFVVDLTAQALCFEC